MPLTMLCFSPWRPPGRRRMSTPLRPTLSGPARAEGSRACATSPEEGVNALLLSTAIDHETPRDRARRSKITSRSRRRSGCWTCLPLRLAMKPPPFGSLSAPSSDTATTSLPGAFRSCTRCPSGVVGPVSASAAASTLPGIVARQYARSSLPRSMARTRHLALPRSARRSLRGTSRLATEDHLQRLALPLVGLLIEEQAHRRFGLPGPNVALEFGHRDYA